MGKLKIYLHLLKSSATTDNLIYYPTKSPTTAMNYELKSIFSKEVDWILPSFGTSIKVATYGLSFAGIHDAFRCLLKFYLNRKDQKLWHHQFKATFEKKLILGKLVGLFFRTPKVDRLKETKDVRLKETKAVRPKTSPTKSASLPPP